VTLKSGLRVTQGHRNRHGSIRHLWLLINVTCMEKSNHKPQDKRRFQSKTQIFPPPCIKRPHWRGSPWSWVSTQGVKN